VSPICPDKEKWLLDEEKYNNWLLSSSFSSNPKTTGSVNESGGARGGCARGADCSHPDKHCFVNGFEYYDGYGEFGINPLINFE
jgi:hypothetical protein